MSADRGRSWLYVPGKRPDRFDKACVRLDTAGWSRPLREMLESHVE